MNKSSATDWAHVDALTDATIDTSDIPSLPQTVLQRMKVRLPQRADTSTIRVDTEVLEWFKSHSDDYEEFINAALRDYVTAHERSTSR
jgi:uncharacterized protein (DUF4415 family)